MTPTTNDKRLAKVLQNTSGFVYHVSIAGITGTRSASSGSIDDAISRLRTHTTLPLAVGFGIKDPAQVRTVTASADAAVVGSAIVSEIENNLDGQSQPLPDLLDNVCSLVSELASGVRL